MLGLGHLWKLRQNAINVSINPDSIFHVLLLLVDFQVVWFFGYLAFLASLLLSQGMKYCRPVCERKLPKINQRCTKNTSKVPHLRSEEATKKQVFIHYAVNGVIRCNKDVQSRIRKKILLVTVLAYYCC